MSRFRVAGLGEVLWDAFPDGEKFGGAPANFACHCRSLGTESAVISCIGKDARGNAAADFLANHGVNISGLAVDDSHETGVVLVTLDDNGKPQYEIKQNTAWDNIPFTEAGAELCRKADAVCFGSLGQRSSLSRNSIYRYLSETPGECLRVFDVNLRQAYYTEDVILKSLALCSGIKLNDEELPVIAGMLGLSGTEEDILRALVDTCRLRIAMLTRGEKGSIMMTPDAVSVYEAEPVEVVNTVGAGDAFTAAAISGLLKGAPLDTVNRHANAVAGFVCTRHGAVPELPSSLCRFTA